MVPHTGIPGKDRSSKFQVRFLLNANCFHTIVKSENRYVKPSQAGDPLQSSRLRFTALQFPISIRPPSLPSVPNGACSLHYLDERKNTVPAQAMTPQPYSLWQLLVSPNLSGEGGGRSNKELSALQAY